MSARESWTKRRAQRDDRGEATPSRALTLTGPMNAVDRCDRCGAQAYVRVFLHGPQELLFCAHHYRQQAAAAQARWRLPNGTERSGTLTTVTVPAIYYAPAGTPVRVWLDRSGEPVAPPPSPGDMIFSALFAGITATACSAVALILCYLLCRMVLDRHRLARWESAWAAFGPRWTSRR